MAHDTPLALNLPMVIRCPRGHAKTLMSSGKAWGWAKLLQAYAL